MATTEEILYGDDRDLWKIPRERASQIISEKINQMQTLYQEVIALADHNDLHVCVGLQWPEGLQLGHNHSMRPDVYWNPSSKYC